MRYYEDSTLESMKSFAQRWAAAYEKALMRAAVKAFNREVSWLEETMAKHSRSRSGRKARKWGKNVGDANKPSKKGKS